MCNKHIVMLNSIIMTNIYFCNPKASANFLQFVKDDDTRSPHGHVLLRNMYCKCDFDDLCDEQQFERGVCAWAASENSLDMLKLALSQHFAWDTRVIQWAA